MDWRMMHWNPLHLSALSNREIPACRTVWRLFLYSVKETHTLTNTQTWTKTHTQHTNTKSHAHTHTNTHTITQTHTPTNTHTKTHKHNHKHTSTNHSHLPTHIHRFLWMVCRMSCFFACVCALPPLSVWFNKRNLASTPPWPPLN